MVGREGNTYFVLYVPTRIFHKLTLILSSQRLLDVAPPYLRYAPSMEPRVGFEPTLF